MSVSHPVAPRDYAAAILAEPDRERRKSLLERCPSQWRDQVRELVESAFQKAQAYRQYIHGKRTAAHQKPPAAPRREDMPNVLDHRKSATEVGNGHLAKLRASIKGAA